MIGRLRGSADFARLRVEGVTVRSGPLRLKFVPGVHAETRIGYALSKSVGSAVVRNRLRRQLRAIFAGLEPAQLPAGDYLVSMRPHAAGASSKELEQYVLAALQQLGNRR